MIDAKYDWMGLHSLTVHLVLLPVALPPYTPVAVNHEVTHSELVYVYTSGFV